MPEGDTVWLASHNLRSALAGEVVVRSDFRVPRYATVDLAGRRIESIAARGKHLLWRFRGAASAGPQNRNGAASAGPQNRNGAASAGPQSGDSLTLHTHFRMDGSWRLYERARRWRGPDHAIRVLIETERWVAIGLRLPVVELLATSREADVVGHLGPDLLGDDWDAARAVARLSAQGSRAVGEVLLDQTVMAGLGNVYKCEICFLRGLDPWASVDRIGDLDGVVDLAKRLMEANRYTARHVTTGDTGRGRTNWVYGRAEKPCRRCGTSIRRGEQAGDSNGRVVYWCPRCQPALARF
ncbi:MAG: DNA-formamidopyrimidine glycosylase family protein [Actinomycetota bacterium]